MLTYYYEYKNCYDYTACFISNGMMAGWLIYGYVIYYSDKNDCEKYSETSFYDSLMIVILFIGYIMGVVYCMLLCTLPCLYNMLDDGA